MYKIYQYLDIQYVAITIKELGFPTKIYACYWPDSRLVFLRAEY